MEEGKRLDSPAAAAAAGTEAKRQKTGPTPAAVSAVLSNGDLLDEILVRLGFPTCLVRAAAVSKFWLRHASDPAFLRRFRDLHPPRLLGFYLNASYASPFCQLEFVPLLPQPPELAAVLRRGRFNLDAYEKSSSSCLDADDDEGSSKRGITGMDCRNGRLFFASYSGGTFMYGVHSPLHPARGVATVPEVPCHLEPRRNGVVRDVLSREIGDGLSYYWFSFLCSERGNATAYFYTLQDCAWGTNATVKIRIPGWSESKQYLRSFLPVDDKIFLVATKKYILVFDSTSSSFSAIKFPEEMVFDGVEILLSQSHDAGFYLVHLKGLELSIWLYRNIKGSTGNWSLLDSICLRGMCDDLHKSDCEAEDGSNAVLLHLTAAGDNAEFVFLNTDTRVFYLDVRSKLLHKVYEITETDEANDEDLSHVHILPFMMIWPPTFPALKE